MHMCLPYKTFLPLRGKILEKLIENIYLVYYNKLQYIYNRIIQNYLIRYYWVLTSYLYVAPGINGIRKRGRTTFGLKQMNPFNCLILL